MIIDKDLDINLSSLTIYFGVDNQSETPFKETQAPVTFSFTSLRGDGIYYDEYETN